MSDHLAAMPRRSRQILCGVPHHVTQRGNHRNQVFFGRGDGLAYLSLLQEWVKRHAIELIAYCLMPNHVHLVVVPSTADGLHRALKVVHGRYALRINRMHGRSGHLWQDRYYSSALDAMHFLNAVRYVELNPVRAGLVDRSESYEWSSSAAHCGLRNDGLVEYRPKSSLFQAIDDWSRWLSAGLPDGCLDRIRRHTSQNLPCGTEQFVEKLEANTGRSLRFRPRGRPRKIADDDGTAAEKVSVTFWKR